MTGIVLGSCIRQQADTIGVFLEDVDRFKERVPSLRVILFENDSTDGTRSLLSKWSDSRPHVSLVLHHKLPGIRTERLSVCRNTILRQALHDTAAGYFVMMDSDYLQHINVDAVVQSIREHGDKTAQFANTEPYHYDVWALRHPAYGYSDVWRDGLLTYFTRWPLHIASNSPPVPVRSAFNGLGVYRLGGVRQTGCEYAGRYPDGYPICEHVPFHECLHLNNASLVINPRLHATTRPGSLFGVPGVHWLILCASIALFAGCCVVTIRQLSRSIRNDKRYISAVADDDSEEDELTA